MATGLLCRLSLSKKLLFQLRKNPGRSVMTSSSSRAKSLLEGLKENPYFDKYAKKITKLQETNPEEFVARIDEKQAKEKKKYEDAKKFKEDAAAKPKLSQSMQKYQAKLSDVMKTELLEDKGKQEITEIWLKYHKDKDCISGVLEPEAFDDLFETASKYPTFLLPLPRENGYEFIMTQFAGTEIHMTPLLWYQAHHENAPECMTMIHYQDFKESKKVVLMRGQFDTKSLTVQEAQCLANQVQLYYCVKNEERFKILKTFNERPNEFKHMDLIKQLETVELIPHISETPIKNKAEVSK